MSQENFTLTSTPSINFVILTVTPANFNKVVDSSLSESSVSGEDITFRLIITNALFKLPLTKVIAEISSAVTPSGYQINDEAIESIDPTKLVNNTIEISGINIEPAKEIIIKVFGTVN